MLPNCSLILRNSQSNCREFYRADKENAESLIFLVGCVPQADMDAAKKGEKMLPSLHSLYGAPDAQKVIATGGEALAAAAMNSMRK